VRAVALLSSAVRACGSALALPAMPVASVAAVKPPASWKRRRRERPGKICFWLLVEIEMEWFCDIVVSPSGVKEPNHEMHLNMS
jgi:hypothetical protein